MRPQRDSALSKALTGRRSELRPPRLVMAPARLGAARFTRYSFARTLLRRAARQGWTFGRSCLDMDADGRGHAVYRVDAEGHVFHFVAFTTTLDESGHTDRVIADAWEVSAALVEGDVSDGFLAELRESVPLQEAGRLDPRVLVLTRGNRSVRFYDYLVDRLAEGRQPEAHRVADAGYIMRSTAFYGNGKFGMRSFLGYTGDHPLRAPYRAQFLAAWLFRELSLDSVEHCAGQRGGSAAVQFDAQWRCYFGLGNATGLGLVPYALKHPDVLNSWAGVRELALANVRAMPATPERLDTLRRWTGRAHDHFGATDGDDVWPWLGPRSLADVTARISRQIQAVANAGRPFDLLYRWAEEQDVETCEFVVSLLIEIDEGIGDDELDDLLRVDESVPLDATMTVGELRVLLDERYDWLDDLGLDGADGDHYWWVVSDNTDEPRRAERRVLEPAHREVAIDAALRIGALRRELDGMDGKVLLGEFLAGQPEHGSAVRRLVGTDQPYGEPRDNACGAGFLPLQLQRFQLAMYGMDNYSPKSTDWLRVTLFQGAPRMADLGPATSDDWVWPPRPTGSPA